MKAKVIKGKKKCIRCERILPNEENYFMNEGNADVCKTCFGTQQSINMRDHLGRVQHTGTILVNSFPGWKEGMK